jgi:hypothetical protein
MELAGLEPATSWVRSSRPLTSKGPRLQRFIGERLECRNISRNSLHRVLRRHEILDRLPAPSIHTSDAGRHATRRSDPSDDEELTVAPSTLTRVTRFVEAGQSARQARGGCARRPS